MENRKRSGASIVLAGIYCAACIVDIVLCLIYRSRFETDFGRKCADWAMNLTVFLLFVPVVPVSLAFSLTAKPAENREHRRWLARTLISPAACLVLYGAAVCVFVAVTGGV